jgi:hypothetical protein
MNTERNFHPAIFVGSRLILLLPLLMLFVYGSDSKEEEIIIPKDFNVPTEEESAQFRKEMLQLAQSTSKQRNELIKRLVDIIRDLRIKICNPPALYTAIGILGELRASESVDVLLDMVDYVPITAGSRPFSDLSLDPIGSLAKNNEMVKALIKIRPPYSSLLKKLEVEGNVIRFQCYTIILIETEGADVSRYILEKSIEKESDERKLLRLNAALKIINERYPIKETNK